MTERHSDDKQIKVTDKRMFTSDGELREEYQGLEDEDSSSAESPTTTTTTPTSRPSPISAPSGQAAAGPGPAGPRSAAPPTAGDRPGRPAAAQVDYPSGAQFEDLVALLAQTTVTFLQQSARPEGRSESLEQAQLYLDLLGILDDKTQGNLVPGEKAMLQDALRQLRLAFAQRT